MISLSTAQKLKAAGCLDAALHDFFALPDRGLDDACSCSAT